MANTDYSTTMRKDLFDFPEIITKFPISITLSFFNE